MSVKYTYVGPGKFLNVPAEDLTEEQFERMPADLRRIVLHSGAYEPVGNDEQGTPLDKMNRSELESMAIEAGIDADDAKKAKNIAALIELIESQTAPLDEQSDPKKGGA